MDGQTNRPKPTLLYRGMTTSFFRNTNPCLFSPAARILLLIAGKIPLHASAINNQFNWLLQTLLTCKQFSSYKIGHDVATYEKGA